MPFGKLFLSAAVLIAAVVAAGLMNTRAAAQPTTQPATQPAEDQGPALAEMTLEEHMETLNVEVRALRRQLMDPSKNADSIERVTRMQPHAWFAKNLKPAKLDFVKDQAEKEALLKAYRVRMAEMLADLMHLEIALINGDNEKAGEHYKAILDHRFKGHNEFRVDD